MDFIEKVLTGLKSHASGIGCRVDEKTPCPYKSDKGFPLDFFCCSNLLSDAITVIEQQKAEIKRLSEQVEGLKAQLEGVESGREYLQNEVTRLRRERMAKVVEVPEDACIREEVVNCPRCDFRTSFKFIIRQQKPETKRKAVVLGASPRKYANCPECGKLINDMDNPAACGHCGAWVEWGSEDGK